jgi:hypothetical protein
MAADKDLQSIQETRDLLIRAKEAQQARNPKTRPYEIVRSLAGLS